MTFGIAWETHVMGKIVVFVGFISSRKKYNTEDPVIIFQDHLLIFSSIPRIIYWFFLEYLNCILGLFQVQIPFNSNFLKFHPKWLVTPIYKPLRPLGRRITPVRGLTNHCYQLLNEGDDPPSRASGPNNAKVEIDTPFSISARTLQRLGGWGDGWVYTSIDKLSHKIHGWYTPWWK